MNNYFESHVKSDLPSCTIFVNFRTPVIFDKLSEHVKLRIGNLAKIPFLETFWEWHLYSKKITNISPFKTELILKFSIAKQHKNFNNVGSFFSSDPQAIRTWKNPELHVGKRLLGRRTSTSKPSKGWWWEHVYYALYSVPYVHGRFHGQSHYIFMHQFFNLVV